MLASKSALRLLFVLVAGIASVSSAAEKEEFRPLFDGKSLDGWVQRGGKAKYEVKNGEIVGTSVIGTPNSFLCTDRDYADFILEVEFKVHPEMNSGIQIRSQCFDEDKVVKHNGKEIKITAGACTATKWKSIRATALGAAASTTKDAAAGSTT